MLRYSSLISVAILSFVIATTICPFGIKFLKRKNIKSKHKSRFRDVHDQVIPRIGGIGIVFGFWGTIGTLLFVRTQLVSIHFLDSDKLWILPWLFGLSMSAFLLGLIDDFKNIRARYKLIVQIVIACITVAVFFQPDVIVLPFFQKVHFGKLGYIVAVVWIVGIMNAMNLIDGLDSLAAGVAAIALLGIGTIAWLEQDMIIFTMTISLIFSLLGFLVYNLHPARVFMGDSGSLFLGFILAVLPFIQISGSTHRYNILPILLLGVPIVDTSFTIIRRSIKGIPLFSADKNHIHHRLIEKGLSHRQSVRRLHLAASGYLLIFLLSSLRVIDIKVGLLAFMALSWLLIFYAGYDERINPFFGIQDRNMKRQNRSFMIQLSNNIDLFYQDAENINQILFTLKIWAQQFQCISFALGFTDSQMHWDENCGNSDESGEEVEFEENGLYLKLKFRKNSLDMDSDLKFELLNKVKEETFKHMNRVKDTVTKH